VKWSDDAVATINSRIDAPVSIWDDIKDPGNGGVMVTLQRIVGREVIPSRSTESPWLASAPFSGSKSVPTVVSTGPRHTS